MESGISCVGEKVFATEKGRSRGGNAVDETNKASTRWATALYSLVPTVDRPQSALNISVVRLRAGNLPRSLRTQVQSHVL